MEFVFVVPREHLFPECFPQGLVRFDAADAPVGRASFEDAVERHGFFVERDHAERTPSLKQVIPYSVVTVGGDVLLTRRLARGGERRLHDKLSIGIGGHLEPVDRLKGEAEGEALSAPRLFESGTRRELLEELRVDGSWSARSIGLINDDSNPVGAVHVGLLQVLTVEGSVRIREEDVLEGRLAPPSELHRLLDEGRNFETWSSIVIEHLDGLVPEPLSASS